MHEAAAGRVVKGAYQSKSLKLRECKSNATLKWLIHNG